MNENFFLFFSFNRGHKGIFLKVLCLYKQLFTFFLLFSGFLFLSKHFFKLLYDEIYEFLPTVFFRLYKFFLLSKEKSFLDKYLKVSLLLFEFILFELFVSIEVVVLFKFEL